MEEIQKLIFVCACFILEKTILYVPLVLKRHQLVFRSCVFSSDQSIGMWDSFSFGEKHTTFSVCLKAIHLIDYLTLQLSVVFMLF